MAVHKVVFWRGSRELAEKPWPYGLDTAKTHARDHLSIYAATHAEVIDSTTREVIFSCGREVDGDSPGACEARRS
jgi:hypothetical protein